MADELLDLVDKDKAITPRQIKIENEKVFPVKSYASGREFSDLYFGIVTNPVAKRLFFSIEKLPFEAQKVIEANEAMKELSSLKQGIVIGSGDNSSRWKNIGWQTLDINPQSGADLICDANKMSDVVPSGSVDFLYAEFIQFDPVGKTGVGWGTILKESNKIMKPGGTIIIDTVDMPISNDATLPDKEQFKRMMIRHGFYPITVGKKPVVSASTFEQPVTYYGIKYKNGYDRDRGILPQREST